MAERGAHLTATSHAKPSIFEVVAQDSLTATIHPAFKRIAVFLASCNPERYGWLVKWYDELYLCLNGIIQYHYLKNHGSSFAENFYSLRRVPILNPSHGIRLPSREETLSLFCLCLFPYVHSKLENLAIRFRLEEADGVTDDIWSKTTRQAIMKIHAMLHMTWEGAVLAQYLSYMSGYSESHSPLLRAAGVTLQYNNEQEDFQWKNVWSQFLSGNFSMSKLSVAVVGNVLTRSLEFGAFFLQFLQWWNAEQSSTSLTALPIPEPCKVIPSENESFENICPICLQTRRIETALPVSGYVFCYRCIIGHLKTKQYCPITKYPATTEDLVRIYSSES